MTDNSTNTTPTSNGGRTCPQCGRSEPDVRFRDRERVCRRCAAIRVMERRLERHAAEPAYRAELRRRFQEFRLASAAKATNTRKPWTTQEENVLLRADVSHREAADLLGRSFGAVEQRRASLRRRLKLAESIRGHAANRRKHLLGQTPVGQEGTK